ncbi:hypothetical protein BGX27_004177, partial [Mortierella sp. AM989]
MIERLRHIGLGMSVRALFETPTLSALAQSLNTNHIVIEAPKNLITLDTNRITPELLPLINITQDDIDLVVSQVGGGVSNIQDIYALSPLQDGILFHHIMATKGDSYLLVSRMSFDNKETLDRYLDAVQRVTDRHDVLRTAIMWENLSTPVQVVLRHATLSITEVSLDLKDGLISDQLSRLGDSREHHIELSQAPLIRFMTSRDADDSWVVIQLMHHIIGDNSTMEVMTNEIQSFLSGQEHLLPESQPFRNLVAQIRSDPGVKYHEQFFTEMLAEVDTPALPYGLSDVHNDGAEVVESYLMLPQILNDMLRGHTRRMGVSLASIFHLAWAQVVSRTSGQERVVFGTVLSGRMQGGSGSDQAMGMFINTLPLRIDVSGISAEEGIYKVQADLAALLEHEHASLALAQRCSSIPAGTPLFSAVLNCRNHTSRSRESLPINGIKFHDQQQRSNYPLIMSIDDFGTDLSLTLQADHSIDVPRICEYMQQTLQSLADALNHASHMQVRDLEILPTTERKMLLEEWNDAPATCPENRQIHQLFEDQVVQSPDAIAVVYEDREISYYELNARSNSLAHHLIDLGVKPDSLVAICVDRSIAMIVAILAVLKAGGAYVPLDPTFANERLHDILTDAAPSILLADNFGIEALGSSISESILIVDPNATIENSTANPEIEELMPNHLAYVIYTSGSTGKPK